MKNHSTGAALSCAFALMLGLWASLTDPAQARNPAIDLSHTVDAYMALAGALANDDVAAARTAAQQMAQALAALPASPASWTDLRDPMAGALAHMAREDADIEAVREQLQPLSTALEAAAVATGYGGPLMRAFCPMAFSFQGASWLQRDRTIANPYFGASMLRCGEIQQVYGPQEHGSHAQNDSHQHPAQDRHHEAPLERLLGQSESTQYICPMHPQIVRDGPARCPICGMNLVPRRQDDSAAATVRIHPAIQQAMNLRTSPVQRGRLQQPISALGSIQVAQSSLMRLTPRTEGWIGEVGVHSVGERVQQGQRLFTLYSRELINVQDEFLQAQASGNRARIDASRQRLEVLGVQSAVIERIRERNSALTWVPWYAERGGYVAELTIRPGSFVMPGLDLIEIGELSQVWLMAEVAGLHRQDLAPGQHAQARLAHLPGQALQGRVELIYPELDPVTRTARARIVLDNPNGALRLGDWAHVQIDGPAREAVLYIPTEALIRTGTEERVVIQDDRQTFSVRQVHAGIESGEFTEILHGLEVGESVVVSGQFLIDSEASIRSGHKRLSAHNHH